MMTGERSAHVDRVLSSAARTSFSASDYTCQHIVILH